MDKKELIHRAVELAVNIQDQGKNHCVLKISSAQIIVRAMKGEYDPDKDYFIRENFDSKLIETSERFRRVMSDLEILLEGDAGV